MGTIIHNNGDNKNKCSNTKWQWIAEAPPKYHNKYYYDISNNNKTVEKIKNDGYVIMVRVDPWLFPQNYQNKIVKLVVNVDKINRSSPLDDWYCNKVILGMLLLFELFRFYNLSLEISWRDLYWRQKTKRNAKDIKY